MMLQAIYGPSRQYDTGVQPSVATDGEHAVEVHKAEVWDTLWYHVGELDGTTVQWSGSHQYDDGIAPSVGIDDGTAVEVHQTEGGAFAGYGLWYHVGSVTDSGVDWDASRKYDKGVQPDVACGDDGLVVEVHKAEVWDELWYNVGTVDGTEVDWTGKGKYDSGENPSVAISGTTVVEVHESQNTSSVWYRVGQVQDGDVDWGDSVEYDEGYNPSVDVTDDGTVVVTHDLNGGLRCRTGTLDGSEIDWHLAYEFDTGQASVVATTGDAVLEVHESQNWSTLWYHRGGLRDYANWMSETAGLGELPLYQVTLPGTHDSATSNLIDEWAPDADVPDWLAWLSQPYVVPWAKTQTLDIDDQLRAGVRFIDLRVCVKDGTLRAYHGLVGDTISTILGQMMSFLIASRNELVVVTASHMNSLSTEDHEAFVELIKPTIGPFLIGPDDVDDLQTTTVGELTADGSRMILFYDDDYVYESSYDKLWTDDEMYYSWANVTDMDDLREYQEGKLAEHAGSPDELFELQWILTPDLGYIAGHLDEGLHGMSERTNHALDEFARDHSDANINVILVDYYTESSAAEIAIRRNEKQAFMNGWDPITVGVGGTVDADIRRH